MKPRSLIALLLGGAGLLLLITGLIAAPGAHADSTPAKSTPVGAIPDDLSHSLQEGFETGNLPASTFYSVVSTCVPGGCGWNVVSSDKHSGTYSVYVPD